MDVINWSSNQINELKNHKGKGLPKIEGRSKNAIYRKMRSLGLQVQCKQPNWSEEELDIICSCDGSYVPEIKGRSVRAIRMKMNKMGIYDSTRALYWTEQEVEILKNYIENKNKGFPVIKGRTKDAIRKKAEYLELKIISSDICGCHLAWSKDELAKVHLIAQGLNVEIKGRSKVAIRNKVKQLNLKKNRLYEVWTEQEICLLKQNRPIKGRSLKSINRKRIDLGLLKRKPRKSWTLKNERILKRLVSKGYSAAQVLKMGVLHKKFTRYAIQKKMCRLNLSEKMSSYKRFSKHSQLLFEKFLKKNWENKLPQELADQWNELNPKEKISSRRVIRYLSRLEIKVSAYEMGKIRRQKEKEEKIIKSSSDFNSAKKLNEKLRSNRVELMRKRFEQNKNIWTGLDMHNYELEAFGDFKRCLNNV